MKQPAREATAYHEAGHMLAAWRTGIRIKRATIVPGKGFAGLVEQESSLRRTQLDSDRARLRAEKWVLIALAGPAAQRHFRRRSWRAFHGQPTIESPPISRFGFMVRVAWPPPI
jgi:hypothetical protein